MQVKAISLAVISHLCAALSCEENVRKRHHEQRKWGKRKERKSIRNDSVYGFQMP